jgi:dTDP-4-amino-4,6-dideoxygalactose transaminase
VCSSDLGLGYEEGDMPETEMAAKETLALPIFPEITQEEQDYVIETVKDFLSTL